MSNWRNRKTTKEARQKAFERAMNRCQICGRKKRQLEIHHLNGWNETTWAWLSPFKGKKRGHNRADNYMVTCHPCHQKLHWKIIKNSLKTEDRFKPQIREKALKELMREELGREIKDERIKTIYRINKHLLTIEEIGRIFNLSKSRISQILGLTKQK